MKSTRKNSFRLGAWKLALALAALVLSGNSALAASAAEIDRDVTAVLQTLYANTLGAKDLGDKARGILVFPNIVKGGFLVTAQYGDGALRQAGNIVGYYRSLAASYGFQAGIESFGYILFLWTTHRFNISTTATAGNSEPGRRWSCWTRASARIFRRRRYSRVSMLLSSTRRD
jgi:lipid-binding SYLF domain-containing protein